MAELLGLKSSAMVPAFSMYNTKPRLRTRRSRTRFTDSDVELLLASFATNPYPDFEARQALADKLHVSESRIAVWFQNKRTRMRKANGLEAGTPGPHSSKSVNVFKLQDRWESQSSSPSASQSSSPSASQSSPAGTDSTPTSSSDSSFTALPTDDIDISSPPLKRRRIDFGNGSARTKLQSLDVALIGGTHMDHAATASPVIQGCVSSTSAHPVDTDIELKDMPLDLSLSRQNSEPVTGIAPDIFYTPLFNFHKSIFGMHPLPSLHYAMYLRSLMDGYTAVAKRQFTSPPVFPDPRS